MAWARWFFTVCDSLDDIGYEGTELIHGRDAVVSSDAHAADWWGLFKSKSRLKSSLLVCQIFVADFKGWFILGYFIYSCWCCCCCWILEIQRELVWKRWSWRYTTVCDGLGDTWHGDWLDSLEICSGIFRDTRITAWWVISEHNTISNASLNISNKYDRHFSYTIPQQIL